MAWLHIHYNSEKLHMPVEMEVLLPQHIAGGSRTINDPGPYQTLYLLHGMTEDQTVWMRRTNVERYAEGYPLAIVMPAGHLGWYTDMKYGSDYFSFITEELPEICERMFPLSPRREDRFIAGLSMGGYGAMKAGLNAYDTYCAAASFSGAVDILDIYDQLKGDEERAAFSDIFGSRDEFIGSVNDLYTSAVKLSKTPEKSPKLYMWCGTDDYLYKGNVKIREHLRKLGFPLTSEEGPGDHQWKYWDECIKNLFDWLPLRKDIKEGE